MRPEPSSGTRRALIVFVTILMFVLIGAGARLRVKMRPQEIQEQQEAQAVRVPTTLMASPSSKAQTPEEAAEASVEACRSWAQLAHSATNQSVLVDYYQLTRLQQQMEVAHNALVRMRRETSVSHGASK